MSHFDTEGTPGGGMAGPVTLFMPLLEPTPKPGCDVCPALAEQRAEARARGDMSAVSDINIEMRNHHRKESA